MSIYGGKPAVLTLCTAEMDAIGQITLPSKVGYCQRHGYRLITEDRNLSNDRPPSWSKVIMMSTALECHSVCMWIDADAMILNQTVAIESILNVHDCRNPPADLYITRDQNGVNCGVFVMRSSQRSYDFLEKVWLSERYINHHWWEQAAFASLIESEWPIRVAYLPKRSINAYPDDYVPGDMILHTAGMANRQHVLMEYAARQPVEHSTVTNPLATTTLSN